MRIRPPAIVLALPLSAALPTGQAGAQNLPPTVSITQATVDQGAATVTITYDLADAEGDACTVSLRASMDGGTVYAVSTAGATGDVGAGIMPGTGRTISWNVDEVPNIMEAIVMVVADDGHAPDIQAMVDQVDADRLAQRLEDLAVPRHHLAHPAALAATRDTLVNAFTAAGLEVALQDVTYGGGTVPNVIGRRPGLVDDQHTWVVDAHYDGVANSPGADDNASGVAATLEIAHILAPYRFKHSIRYIGFAFEEQGLVGSGHYVQSGIPAWETVGGVLNLEMIGYYSDTPYSQELPAGFEVLFPEALAALEADSFRGNFLTVVGNTASQPLIDAYLAACAAHVPGLRTIPLAVPGNGQIAPDLRRSDHARFWDAGMQALMLTDGSEFRNPNYHTPLDAVDSLHIGFLTDNTKATLAALAMLAQPMNAGMDTHAMGTAGLGGHGHGFPCVARLFPNPAADVLRLELDLCTDEHIVARLFDMEGRRVMGRDLRPAAGARTFELAIGDVPP
ncbi:MAG: M28 family peptidase, partial [Flavobacteriales bacterium]|nr:M28 family peptidase [Flavobacteriales bacterium]